MGKYVASVIRDEVHNNKSPAARNPFRYHDRGMLATIGRAKAVGLVKGVKVRGWLAWVLWAVVHVAYLIGFRNRLIVMLEWAWAYLAFRRGARLITGDTDLELHIPRTGSDSLAAERAAINRTRARATAHV
jgi:NADH dehydrogenase